MLAATDTKLEVGDEKVAFSNVWLCAGTKEYVSLVERTATPERLTKSPLTQPLPVCSVQRGR